MCLTLERNVLKLPSEGMLLNFPLFFWTKKFHQRKLNPSVEAVTLVFFWLRFIPLSARNYSTLASICFALSFGFNTKTMSSAYLIYLETILSFLNLYSPIFSIPLSAMLARSGLTTPPWGVFWLGNCGLIPLLRHRRKPPLMYSGAITLSKIALWLMRSKHFSMSISMTRLFFPFCWLLRFRNRILVESMEGIIPRTSLLDRSVRFSPHCAPEISLVFPTVAHVDVMMTASVYS